MMIADGAKVPHENYCAPRVEVELAFVLGNGSKVPASACTDVLRATEYVVPAIEIVDARVQNPRKIFDTIADNGAAAGIVIGGRPVGPMDVDLRWVGGIMYQNAEIEETGLAAGVLGHPAMGVAWLANKLGQIGVALEPGHIVLAGSFTRVVWAKKATPCTPTSARSAASPFNSSEGVVDGNPPQRLQARHRRRATADRPVEQPVQQHRRRDRRRFGFDWILLDTEHSPNEIPDLLSQLQAMQARHRDADRAAGLERRGADQALPRHRRADGAGSLRAERGGGAARGRRDALSAGGIRGVAAAARASRYGRVTGYLNKADERDLRAGAGRDPRRARSTRKDRQGRGRRRRVHRAVGSVGFARPSRQSAASRGAGGDEGRGHRLNELGKAAGILTGNEEEARRYIDWGYMFVAVGADIGLLARHADALAKKFKPALP